MKRIIAYLLALLLVLALATSRSTHTGGIAWDFGGVDSGGVYLCAASGHMQGTEYVHDWDNPLAPVFPDLVADC